MKANECPGSSNILTLEVQVSAWDQIMTIIRVFTRSPIGYHRMVLRWFINMSITCVFQGAHLLQYPRRLLSPNSAAYEHNDGLTLLIAGSSLDAARASAHQLLFQATAAPLLSPNRTSHRDMTSDEPAILQFPTHLSILPLASDRVSPHEHETIMNLFFF